MTDNKQYPGLPQKHLDALLDHIHEHGTTSEGVLKRVESMLHSYVDADRAMRAAQPYDHGPMAATIEEAARDVGKWLNERPNRPLDLRHVAMLAHHAQAAQPDTAALPRPSDYQGRSRAAYLSGYEDALSDAGINVLPVGALAAPTTQAPRPAAKVVEKAMKSLRALLDYVERDRGQWHCRQWKDALDTVDWYVGRKMAAQPVEPAVSQGISLMPDVGSPIVNEAAWKFVEAMPHQLPGPIWNDLKPALYAALKYFHATQPQEALTQEQIDERGPLLDGWRVEFDAEGRNGPGIYAYFRDIHDDEDCCYLGPVDLPQEAAPSQDAEDAARNLFDAGWKAAARFCNRDDVVADGIVGGGGCPQFEKAFDAARAQEVK